MKKISLILGLVVILLAGGVFLLVSSIQDPDDIVINSVDFSTMENGTYYGEYETSLVSVKVKVDIAGGQLANVEILEHNNGKGQPAEAIIDDVVDAQSLDVDTVSGATMSSKVLLKAIEEAFSSEE